MTLPSQESDVTSPKLKPKYVAPLSNIFKMDTTSLVSRGLPDFGAIRDTDAE